MTDVAVDTLRLRGQSAQRLARVAATVLPAALERALSGIGDVTVDRVSVVLDVDPQAYDDGTLAVLWADAIRARVVAAARTGQGRPTFARTTVSTASATTPSGPPGEVAAAALAWIEAAGEVEPAVLPPSVLAIFDPALVAQLRALMPAEAWKSLSDKVSQSIGRALAGRQTQPPTPAGAPGPDEIHPAAKGHDELISAPPPATKPDVITGGTPEQLSSPWADPNVLAELASLAADRVEGLKLSTVTRAAGLVLLYPWLADYCRRAEDLHPALDPVDVREAALAMIVDPQDPRLADDPVIAFFAGRPAHDVRARHRVALPHGGEVAESADRLLADFAVTLRGFEQSSRRFVRDAWIVRLGVLDTDCDPALLTATTNPLDVVLSLLPYPIGLVKLPWSRLLTIRFRGGA